MCLWFERVSGRVRKTVPKSLWFRFTFRFKGYHCNCVDVVFIHNDIYMYVSLDIKIVNQVKNSWLHPSLSILWCIIFKNHKVGWGTTSQIETEVTGVCFWPGRGSDNIFREGRLTPVFVLKVWGPFIENTVVCSLTIPIQLCCLRRWTKLSV